VVRYVLVIKPLRHFVVIIRDMYQKGTGLRFIWKEAGAMGTIRQETQLLSEA
jgi:hypothetical protein